MILDKIFDNFPPPKFLDIPFAGLSITDSYIHCIQFGKKDGTLCIEKYKEINIAPGVVTFGQVNDPAEVTRMLLALKKDLNINYVKVSVPEEKAYIFTTKIPVVRQEEVRGSVESKIEENVPVPPGELAFDYKLSPHPEKEHLDIVVSALQIRTIDIYMEMMQKADLSPLSLEVGSQAVARSVVPRGTLGTNLILNFGKEKVGLYVAVDRVVYFTSTVAFKGESATKLDFLSQEIKKLYTYWHTLKENLDKPERNISQIIVCGDNFGDDVVSSLSATNPTPIILADVWINAFDINKTVPTIPFVDSLRYASAIGLALPRDILI